MAGLLKNINRNFIHPENWVKPNGSIFVNQIQIKVNLIGAIAEWYRIYRKQAWCRTNLKQIGTLFACG